MKWGNFVFVTGVLVFVLTIPAAPQDWVDIKSSKELRALHSNKTFKFTFMGVPVVAHYRADGKGLLISADLRMPCTWEVKGNDQVCISDERSNFLLMIGAIEPLRDRRNEASGGSPKWSHPVIGEIEPVDDHRNRASW